MGGRITAVTSDVDYTLPDTLVAAIELWVTNSGAGAITVSVPSGITGAAFVGGGTTYSLPAGKKACFLNVSGNNIHIRQFD